MRCSGIEWTCEPRRRRMAACYLVGSGLAAAAALILNGIWLWLLWPAAALLLVALCYGTLGEDGFLKNAEGTAALATRVLLVPYFLGAWINSRLWTLRDPGPVHVTDGVWIGRFPSRRDIQVSGAKSIIDLAAELPAPRPACEWCSLPMLDLVTPGVEPLRRAAAAIERRRLRGAVLVSCALGCSRSPAAVATWLLASGRAATASAAVASLRGLGRRVVLGTAELRVIAAAASRDGDDRS